jgi:hypothetical protein
VGTENLDQRTASTSETGSSRALLDIEGPTLEKAQAWGSPLMEIESGVTLACVASGWVSSFSTFSGIESPDAKVYLR